MSVITDNYQLAFDEINPLVKAIYKGSEDIVDDIMSLLVNAYVNGCNSTSEQLDWETYVDIELMDKSVNKVIADKTFEDRARKHIEEKNLQGLIQLAESEFHRVFNDGAHDEATYIERDSGKKVFKQWNTMLDERVRATHDGLEGMAIPLEDEFYTFDGDHAYAPGGFENAENNVNCRCVLDFEAI